MTGRRLFFCERKARLRAAERAFPRAIAARGFEVSAVTDGPLDLDPTDIVWLHGNLNWFPEIRRALRSLPASQRPFVIVFHVEPLPLPQSAVRKIPLPNLRELTKIMLRDKRATDMRTNARRIREMAAIGVPDLLIVSSLSRREFLAEQGIDSHFVPQGYYAELGSDMGLTRDIDAVFIGTMEDPRHRAVVDYLRRRGVDLVARGSWKKGRGFFGAERNAMINRSRTFLALQRHPGKLAGQRMVMGMANRSLVIAEPIYRPQPFVPGTHFVSVPLADMPDAIRHYLDNEAERVRIADAGHQFVTTELTLERTVAEVMRLAGLT